MGTHVGERECHARTFEMVETGPLRARIETAIDALLALLDEIDGDTDQEPDEEGEPSLGFLESGQISHSGFALEGCEADDSDDEPWLGSISGWDGDQTRWTEGSGTDGEPDAGEEPENDPADDGLADADALADYAAESYALNALATGLWINRADRRHRDEMARLRQACRDAHWRKAVALDRARRKSKPGRSHRKNSAPRGTTSI